MTKPPITKRIRTAWQSLKGYPIISAAEDIADLQHSTRKTLKDARATHAAFLGLFQQLYGYQDFLKLKSQLDQLARFIGDNYAAEIRSGQHKTFDTAIDAAIHYLAQALREQGKQPVFSLPTDVTEMPAMAPEDDVRGR